MTHSSSKTGNPPIAAAQIKRDNILGLGLGLLGVIMFSGTLPATRYAIAVFDPWFLTFGRATAAGLAAILTLVLLRRPFPRAHLGALAFAGLALVFGFPGFMAVAMLSVPSAHGGVVLGILPLMTAIFATIWAGERPSPVFWLCGIIGAGLIVLFALRDGGWGFDIGDIWLVAAGVSASSGYVVSGKLSRILPGWEVICWALVLWLPLSAVGTIYFWDTSYLSAPAPQLWAFSYVAFGSMFLGFFAWNTGLKLGGIAKVGQLQLLQTFFTLAIAAALLGETITLETLAFATAVLCVILAGRKAQVSR